MTTLPDETATPSPQQPMPRIDEGQIRGHWTRW